MPSPLNSIFYIWFCTWAALVAVCALPYVRLRHQLGLETADALQWLLVVIGAFGTVRVLHAARQVSRDRAWRASHGLFRTSI